MSNCSVLEKLQNCNRADKGAQKVHILCLKAIQYNHDLKYSNQIKVIDRVHVDLEVIYSWDGRPERSDTGVIEMRSSYLETTYTPKTQLGKSSSTKKSYRKEYHKYEQEQRFDC